MGAVPKKSKKSQGFKARKRKTNRPLARTGKHKKSAPAIKNLAATVASGEKGAKRAIFEECAALAREKSEGLSEEAQGEAVEVMEQ